MSDIFVSYDDQDRPRVRHIVETLEARGWSVWWDHRIATGEAFARVIERELEAACCVIVVWTKTSVRSEWVRAEADEAWKRHKLVPVLLDRVKPSMPFGQIQAADLIDWHEQGHQGFTKSIADLRERIGKAPVQCEKPPWIAPFQSSRPVVGIGAVILLSVATITWYIWPRSERGPAGAERPPAAATVASEPPVAAVSAPSPTAAARSRWRRWPRGAVVCGGTCLNCCSSGCRRSLA